MKIVPNKTPVPGWKGGFIEANPEMNYPTPDLNSLELTDNMDNISKITRQQRVLWPEFTWETQKDEKDPKRCFQMFAPDISRVGYDDAGQTWSIICPQQGTYLPGIGTLNVEVTVTKQGGWVNESDKTMAANLCVKPKIWFSPSALQNPAAKLLWAIFNYKGLDFPSEKSRAIELNTFLTTSEKNPIINLRDGLFLGKENPSFTDHSSEAWNHAQLEVEIGHIDVNPHPVVAEFNKKVMEVFNLGSGNMLQQGNTLAWNVWFDAPSLVDRTEWRNHAEYWRKSIDVDHTSPDGPGTKPRFADGTDFSVEKELIEEATKDIIDWVRKEI